MDTVTNVTVEFDPKTLSVLNRFLTVLEKITGELDSSPEVKPVIPSGSNTAPAAPVPVKIPKPKYKSASGQRVTEIASCIPVLAEMGVRSKGCNLLTLASPEVSKYYVKSWLRDKGSPSDPVSYGLLRVLKTRQKELGIEFNHPTGTLNTGEADALIEALKSVGRELLRV